MTFLLLGLVLFLGVHVFSTLRGPRAALIARLGPEGYKGLYSALALIGLGLIIWGFGRYRAAGMIPVWDPPMWTRHLAMPLVWFAFVAIASRRAPGMIMFGSLLAFAVYDRIAVKRRGDAGAPRLDAFTRGDAIALGAGTAVYVLFLFLHPWLFGVSVLRG